MKVKLKKNVAHPEFAGYEGDTINVADEHGKNLVEAGAAEKVKTPAKPISDEAAESEETPGEKKEE